MLYSTGNIPHMSMGNFLTSHNRINCDNPLMDERDKFKDKIEGRMKELGYNPRSLSMKLFKKPDRVRNFLDGKSQNMRGDTYKAIMAELWPKENEPYNAREAYEKELGMRKGLEMLIWALVSRGRIPKEDLETLFNYQLREFRAGNQSTAAGVMDQLLDFLHSGVSQLKQPEAPQSPSLPLGKSKKEIS